MVLLICVLFVVGTLTQLSSESAGSTLSSQSEGNAIVLLPQEKNISFAATAISHLRLKISTVKFSIGVEYLRVSPFSDQPTRSSVCLNSIDRTIISIHTYFKLSLIDDL